MKPTVHYDKTQFSSIILGSAAFVKPIDHTNHLEGHHVSNTTHVMTSRVVKIFPDGSFETLNTFYKPRSTK